MDYWPYPVSFGRDWESEEVEESEAALSCGGVAAALLSASPRLVLLVTPQQRFPPKGTATLLIGCPGTGRAFLASRFPSPGPESSSPSSTRCIGAFFFPWMLNPTAVRNMGHSSPTQQQGPSSLHDLHHEGNSGLLLYQDDNHPSLLLLHGLCVPELALHQTVSSILQELSPARVVLFDHISWTSITTPLYDPSQCRRIACPTPMTRDDDTPPPLEPLNTISGFPAAVVTQAKCRGIPVALYLAPLESGVHPVADAEIVFRILDQGLTVELSKSNPATSSAEHELLLRAQRVCIAGKQSNGGKSMASPSNHLYL